jgi:hypothetical protein
MSVAVIIQISSVRSKVTQTHPSGGTTMSFRVEKIKRNAEIFFPDGSTLSGSFFVSHQSPKHTGPESVCDILTNERTFIPFEVDGQNVLLLQKRSVVKLRLETRELDRDVPYLKEIKARIQLVSGEFLEGNVYLDLPKSHSRLSDFLNYSPDFFYLEVEQCDYLVNANFVRHVEPFFPVVG